MNEMTLSFENILDIGTSFTKSGVVLTVLFAVVIVLIAKALVKTVDRMLKKAVAKLSQSLQT